MTAKIQRNGAKAQRETNAEFSSEWPEHPLSASIPAAIPPPFAPLLLGVFALIAVRGLSLTPAAPSVSG
jgi:hypothetical protein